MRFRRVAVTFSALVVVAAVPLATAASNAVTPSAVVLPASAGPTIVINAAVLGPVIDDAVYGVNFPSATFVSAARPGLQRWGGNATTRYDFRTDLTNSGNDWYYENHIWGDTALPGGVSAVDSYVKSATAAGSRTAVTVPVLGQVAKDAISCGFPTTLYGTEQSTDSWRSTCGNGVTSGGNPLTVTQPSSLTSVAFGPTQVKAMATHIAATAARAARRPIFLLDNEPSLWNSTHRDVQPSAILGSTFFTKSIAAADAVIAGTPGAVIAGPNDWGWCAYFYFPADNCAPGSDRVTNGNRDLAAAYLRAFKQHDVLVGHRTLSVLDEHFYPQGDGVALAPAGSAATQALRLRSTRALWDPAYLDESWINQTAFPHVDLLPRMKAWVAAQYPGTGIAIGEYNFGGLESMNGALAQADVLGILGRAGVMYAALWDPPESATAPGTFAFRMFRNLDGHGAGFGNRSVSASSSNQSTVSTYAALRPDGNLTVVLINKTGHALVSPLSIAGYSLAGKAVAYRYLPSNLGAIGSSTVAVSPHTAITVPASSITTLVIPKRAALAVSTSANSVIAATTVRLTARLTRGGFSVPGAPVRFYSRVVGTSTWVGGAVVTTNSTGYASTIVRPTRTTDYAVRDTRPVTGTVAPAIASWAVPLGIKRVVVK